MKKTKKLLSLLTALAITASSFAAMVIPASAEPDDPATPTWQIGYDGATPGQMETGTFHEKNDVLHVSDKNVFAKLNDISTGTVTIDTDVYTDPNASPKRTFRIILQSDSEAVYDTNTAFAQVAANGDTGNIFAGGESAAAKDNTELQFPITAAGWYHIQAVVNYDKVNANDFITVSVSDAEGNPIGNTENVPTFSGVDKTLKAIRLVSTAGPETYFADFKVTPGSVLAEVTPTEDPDATKEPSETTDPGTPTEAPEPIDTTVHYSESFETHNVGDIIKAATEAVENVTLDGDMGKATFTVGSRSSMEYWHYAAVAQDAETQNKYIDIASSNYSSSNRGVKMFFGDTTSAAIEAPAGAGQYLVTEFDVKFDANFVNDSPKKMVLMGDKNIDIDAETTGIGVDTWRSVQVIVEKATGSYVVVVKNKADDKLVTVLNGTTQMTKLNGLNFDNGGPKAGSHAYLDDIKVTTTSDLELGKLAITVKDNSEEPLPIEGAEVVIEGVGKLTTDASGQVSILVPAGEYNYSITASGYEATEEQGDAKTGTVTVTKDGGSEEVTLLKQVYTAEPGTVTVKGGQQTISAATGDTPNASTAFTVDVLDQMGVAVEDGYTTEWKVYPTGTTEANSAVTIENGVVSVSKDYKAPEGKDAEVFDVIATVTLNDKSKDGTAKINVANSDIITYDNETVYAPTGRSTTFDLPSAITMPATGRLRIAFDFIPGSLGTDSNASATTVFKNGNTVLFGLQRNSGGLYAFTTNAINTACNQSTDYMNFTDYALLGAVDSNTTYPVEFSALGDKLVVSFEGNFYTLPFAQTMNVDKITIGNYRLETAFGMTVKNLITGSAVKINENAMDILGDTNVAKIKGKTVTRQYEASPAVEVEGETFTWTMEPATYEGVTLSTEGVLSITDTAEPGTVKIKAVSSTGDGEKKAELDVTIADFQELTLKADGPLAYHNKAGETGQYVITSAVDGCEDEIKDNMPAPAWSSSDTSVATINEESGELTVVGKGETTVTATVTNDEKVSKVEIPVVVDNYYITGEVEDGAATTDVDVADIVAADKYLVTTADADGKLVKQEEVDAPAGIAPPTTKTVASEEGVKITATYTGNALTSITAPEAVAVGDEITEAAAGTKVFFWKSLASMEPAKTETKTEQPTGPTSITINTEGAAKYEVAPIFEADTIGAGDERYTFAIPADTYNFTVTMNGRRADIYANDQLVVNNMLQYGSEATDVVNDIVVSEGYAKVWTTDYETNATAATSVVTAIKVVKSPSVVTRKTKMYVLGDSLVCKYYNGGSSENKLAQTGWGQVLQNYITDDIEVVDIANSGVTAVGLLNSAYSQVMTSAKAGDYVILESGYNDNQHSTMDIMKASVTTMVEGCKEKGLNIVLVSPNASNHDYRESVQFTSGMNDVATATSTNFINLSKLSYDYLVSLYGTDGFSQELALATWNVSDRLHSTYNGANKWASIMATEIGKLYPDANLVNTEYTYTFTDTAETPNTITCQATAPVAPTE